MVNPVTEGTSLDDILSDNEPEAAPVAEQPQEPEASAEGPARGPDGKFVAKQSETGVEPQPSGDADAGPPPDKLPPEEYGVVRAIRDENKTLKQELESLKQQFQQAQQPKEPPVPPPSMWEDEQGWQQHFGAQVVQQASLNAALNLSEMLTRKENAADFDEMKARFLSMAEQNPAIVQQALSDPDPWGKAYKIAKNAATMESLGATDLDTLKAKMREELMAELQQGQTPVPQQQVNLPPTLSGERNVGSRSGPTWGGPRTLDDLLS